MKILFLDVDGVLNSSVFFMRTQDQPLPLTAEEKAIIKRLLPHVELPPGAKNTAAVGIDLRNLDSDAIRLLNQITERPDVAVVVSSTWRHGYTVRGLQLLLESRGFIGRVIGKTRELWGQDRGAEIQEWLVEHPDVDSIAILDDNSDMDPLRSRLVQTDGKVGLQSGDVDRVIELLGLASV
jgi:hypothetical protein